MSYAQEAGTDRARRFVLNVPLLGAPADRRERLLRGLLQNRAQVLRLLLLMLVDERGNALEGLLARGFAAEHRNGASSPPTAALFEPLMRALAIHPGKLDDINRLVCDLEGSPDGRALLPEGFASIWGPIWGAREEALMK